jgi:hypothetical protein
MLGKLFLTSHKNIIKLISVGDSDTRPTTQFFYYKHRTTYGLGISAVIATISLRFRFFDFPTENLFTSSCTAVLPPTSTPWVTGHSFRLRPTSPRHQTFGRFAQPFCGARFPTSSVARPCFRPCFRPGVLRILLCSHRRVPHGSLGIHSGHDQLRRDTRHSGGSPNLSVELGFGRVLHDRGHRRQGLSQLVHKKCRQGGGEAVIEIVGDHFFLSTAFVFFFSDKSYHS